MLFRPVKESDLGDIYELALKAGFGLTSLCKDERELGKRIDMSIRSFSKKEAIPLNENYLFVLEDTEQKKVVGTSAIDSAIGYETPSYSYRLSTISKISHQLDLHLNHKVLMLNNDLHGLSEIGTLFLDRDYRKNNNGLVLSLSRFLFMAAFRERFSDFVIAEMRGVSDQEGISPFWESLGKHFFNIPFVKADEMTGLSEKQFIADLLPHSIIYTALLSKGAQSVIGKPHQSTKPALKILEAEGFLYNGYVDIFDAGPTIKARLKDVKTVKKSKQLKITGISDHVHDKSYFISNDKLAFRATQGELLVKEDTCIMPRKIAALLSVDKGDMIRAVNIRSKK
jgi:arginine N-succinyltransferase